MLKNLDEFRKDRGDGVLVLTLICIPLFMLAFWFAAGMAQNGWAKTSLADQAQAAAQTAAGDINNAGYLDQGSMGTFVSEYMRLSNRITGNSEQVSSGGYQSNEAATLACSSVEVNGKSYKSPYIELSLDRTRTQGVSSQSGVLYTSEAGATPKAVFTLNDRVNYRVISATVYEASSSLLGNGFAMVGKDSGCFTSVSKVSGITFGANEDLELVGGDASCFTPENPTAVDNEVFKTMGSIKLYSGPDYTCPTLGYLTSPYLKATAEYGSFYKISYGGKDYWVDNLDTRAPEACTTRSTADRKAAITPAQTLTATGSPKTYSAPFLDCEDGGTVSGKVTATARYNGPFANFTQLNSGKWVRSESVKQQFTVTFNTNGGTEPISAPPAPVTVNDGGQVAEPAEPRRGGGYSFNGWSTSPTSNVEVQFPVTVSGDITYYAIWGKVGYTISYNGNGGTVAGCKPTVYNVTDSVTFNDDTCSTIARAGHQFNGWDVKSIPAGSTGNKTITAMWIKINYKITYNLNGGNFDHVGYFGGYIGDRDQAVASIICGPTSYNVTDPTYTIKSSCKPARAGYQFINWTPSTIPSGSTGAKTFVAQWARN